MVRNVQATSATGLRKNRVTQKTRLRVVRGELDLDALIPDEEEERNRVLASQGVDAEDANEHHLQVALNGKQTQRETHIPTPDAAGLVANYSSLYPSAKYKQPTTHLRFSETVDEVIEGGLAGGFTYFLDERDLEWLERNNQEARGEGTSASANGAGEDFFSSATRSGRALHNRSTKCKGKDPEHPHPPVRILVDETEFELVMGLFEKFTEEKFPFIHLSLDNFPPFSDYEPMFSVPLPPATFASHFVLASAPSPERLVLAAHTVYQHWKARKVERVGQRVVPQLDYDDANESSYTCFRRRDIKPVRRTRASSTAYTDKLSRLRTELQMGLDLAKMVLEREQMKTDTATVAQEVWRARCQLVEEWRAGDGKTSGIGMDESLLFDKERVPKKPKVEGLGRIILGLNRRATGPQSASGTPNSDQHSPLTAHLDLSTVNALSAQSFVAIQSAAQERHKYVQTCVEREMNSLRTQDNGWEDLLDLPYQTPPIPHPNRLFQACRLPSASPNFGIDPAETLSHGQEPVMHGTSQSDADDAMPPAQYSTLSNLASKSHLTRASSPPAPQRAPRSLRFRTGRGGRLHFDRRLHTRRAHPLLNVERARWPRLDSCSPLHQRRDDWEQNEEVRWTMRDKPKDSACSYGEEYWGHESIYEDHVALGKRSLSEYEGNAEEVGIGFEYGGYGLGLVTAAQWEKGHAVESRKRKLEPVLRENGDPNGRHSVEWDRRTAEEVERGYRLAERWCYDPDPVPEEEDRFLLDDFQPKFLRNMITLLDAADHEALKTDAKNLTPPHIPDASLHATRSSSRLGEQERVRPVASKSVAPSLQPQLLPLSLLPPNPPAPSTTPPLPLPQISSASGRVEGQIRKLTRQTPSASPTTASTKTGQRTALPQAPASTPMHPPPNGSPSKAIQYPNGIVVENGPMAHANTSARPQSHSPQQPQSQQGANVNGLVPHQRQNHLALHPGHAHGLNPQQYASLRNVFAEPMSGVQQQQQPQQGRSPMMAAIPGANVNIQIGPGTLNLKLPTSRQGQLRMNGITGADVNGIVNVGAQHGPMLTTPPRPNGGSPVAQHARVNGHLLTPHNANASPVNAHLLGRVSPLAQATLATSPHNRPHLVPLHSSPQARPGAPPMHQQQVVGGAGQGGYS